MDASNSPSPRKRGRPAQAASDSLKTLLIAVSARLFREKGFDNTTVRDIAAAAGVQAGSWFYHFKSKQDILQAVIEEGMQQALARIEEVATLKLPPREAFRRLVHTHLETLLSPGQDFVYVMLYEWRALSPEGQLRIVAAKDRYEKLWDAVLRELQASGEWPAPGKLDRLWLFGALNWSAQWYRRDAGVSIEELAESAIRFLLR
ncbi:TetR/AcrR family transcriptional regulator [Duganella sp. Root1480D1]|uniref:TetR/AcrR family transcriptional regulator n=1 Tax=Duganella sp. Root1480D1 TaxID=1736471 RepID=UPI00070FF812|nr:TetR/AcrR family transcriptional regulator [Duganella sp. Root1480D1]KQZ40043.1 TetR family transcriptional regulator [Duganella sp. Root1480D1]